MALIELTIQEPALIKNPAFKRTESGSKPGDDDGKADPKAEDEITDLTLDEEADADTDGGLSTKLLAIAIVGLAVLGVLTLKKLRGSATPDAE